MIKKLVASGLQNAVDMLKYIIVYWDLLKLTSANPEPIYHAGI